MIFWFTKEFRGKVKECGSGATKNCLVNKAVTSRKYEEMRVEKNAYMLKFCTKAYIRCSVRNNVTHRNIINGLTHNCAQAKEMKCYTVQVYLVDM